MSLNKIEYIENKHEATKKRINIARAILTTNVKQENLQKKNRKHEQYQHIRHMQQ